MNLTEKIKALSEELGVPYERICYVIGMKADELELAVNGDEKFRQRAENFFSTREYAMSQYTDDQNGQPHGDDTEVGREVRCGERTADER